MVELLKKSPELKKAYLKEDSQGSKTHIQIPIGVEGATETITLNNKLLFYVNRDTDY